MSDITDYAQGKLPYQFQDKLNWQSYINAAVAIPDAMNNKANILILDIDNSVGLELDTIGEILGSKRNARSDNDYRLELKLYSKLNNAKGTPNFFIFQFSWLGT